MYRSRALRRMQNIGDGNSIEALQRKFGGTVSPVQFSDQLPLKPLVDFNAPAPMPGEPELAALDLAQKCALVQMSAHRKLRALYQELRLKFDVPPFTASTFFQLREQGYAQRAEGERFHSLTMRGSALADLAAKELQKEYRIHVGYLGGNMGASTSLLCVCGWSCGLPRYNADNPTRIQLEASAAIARHIHTVEAVAGLAEAMKPPTKQT